jgi:peptide-methionine (R)-S-oxide reductase
MVVGALVRKEKRRVAKQVSRERAAAVVGNAVSDEEALHEVRKTARRGRYSAEACRGVRAWYTARRLEHLQDILGSHRDATLAAAIIDEFPDPALAAARQRLADKAARKLHGYERLARHRAYRAVVKEKQDDKQSHPADKTDDEWRATLSAEEYRVLRQAGTEQPFSHSYETDDTVAAYECRACGSELFRSETKFDAHCGWPAFYAPLAEDRVEYIEDRSFGSVRTEVRCANCGSHLGHVFEGEGFDTPTDQRFCINGVALRQRPD